MTFFCLIEQRFNIEHCEFFRKKVANRNRRSSSGASGVRLISEKRVVYFFDVAQIAKPVNDEARAESVQIELELVLVVISM